MQGIIYLYRSKTSGKCYVGQTTDEKKRWRTHREANGGCKVFHRAIRKYGFNDFEYSILHSGVETAEELNRLEQKEILFHDSVVPNGYNLDSGYGPNRIISEESRERRRNAQLGKKQSDETKLKHSIAKKGKKQSPESIAKRVAKHIGSKRTPEQRARMSAWQIGKVLSEEHRLAIGAGLKGHSVSQEQREKLRITSSKAFTEERKERMRHLHGKPVRCIETGIVYFSMREAQNKTGAHNAKICLVCQGHRHTAGGFHWEYA